MKSSCRRLPWLLPIACMLAALPAGAVPTIYEWHFNTDGAVTNDLSSPLVGGGALGWSEITVTGAGDHSFAAFFDYEIDESVNTFFNEYGVAHGVAAAGQSWEIDEPGYVFGDIYNNFVAGTLDGTNGVPSTAPDDVSMALGWNFSLAAGETATITLLLADVAPLLGFYLEQVDPDSGESVFFSSRLTIAGGGTPVPEPSTMCLVALGLASLLGMRTRRAA